jgi:L,D-transpeptidase catalytic domain
MKVWYRRHLIGDWPVSTGRPGYDTPNGTYLTIEKGNPTRMVGDGCDLLVPYAVRFTWSGMYIHAADWSVPPQAYSCTSRPRSPMPRAATVPVQRQ